ncbi:MAG: thiosulfate sulfurtransferase GlpE [Deltaproteobacteria bacterium]|nr:thiosulfate sulfurtransferase GlpE [Deltaproteobacteria bacterium]MCB9487403.1 thiosulfate sulfurtransferase GlpE [Deltaproteobacteria bacterium]
MSNQPLEIDMESAKELLDGGGAIFVDVRDPMSYKQAHIPGAIHVTDSNVQEFVEQTAKSSKVIVYCYHGMTSQGGAQFFRAQGFEECYSMVGGFEAWRFRFDHTGS